MACRVDVLAFTMIEGLPEVTSQGLRKLLITMKPQLVPIYMTHESHEHLGCLIRTSTVDALERQSW